MADFRVKDSSIDPMAFANVLQRKAQMEQAQANADREHKDNRLKRITDAVQAGQSIAMNMMTIAEKRGDVKKQKTEAEGQQELIGLFKEPTSVNPADPMAKVMQPAFEADRNKRFMQALVKANLPDTTKALLEQKFESSKQTAGDTEVRSLLDPKTKQVSDYIVNKKNKTVSTLGGTPLPKERADELLRGYAPKQMTDQFGNPVITPNLPGAEASTASKAVMEEGGIPALQSKAPKLAERFVEAQKAAFPVNNQSLKEAVDSGASAAQVGAILKQPNINQVGLKSLGFHLARMSGSNSQLSDAERETFEQPLSFLETIKNKGYRLVAGDLSPVMKKDLTQLADLLAKKEKLRGQRAIQAAKINAKSQVGKTRWDAYKLEKEFPTIDDLIVDSNSMLETDSDLQVDQNALNAELKRRGL